MKQKVTMLAITICGIDSKERSRIFRLVSKAAVVGSQVIYVTGDTIECSLPASRSSEIPDGFFDLVSTHEGSSLKVESKVVDTEDVLEVADESPSDLTEGTQQRTDCAVEEKEDLNKEDNNEKEKEEDKGNSSKSSEDSGNIPENSDKKPQGEVKKRGKAAVLTDDFCDEEIEDIVMMSRSKENNSLVLDDLIDNLARLLDITDQQKKETFSKLMKLADKCYRNDPEKPVTTRVMKKANSDISADEWTNAVTSWLRDRVRKHKLTLSTFFEYVFRCVHKWCPLNMDSSKPVMMPILLDEKREEFQNQFEKIMSSEELSKDEKVRSILKIFGVTDPKAIRLAWQVIQSESTVDDLSTVAKDALISKEDFADVMTEIALTLKKSGLLDDSTTVDSFLNHLRVMITLYS